MRHRFSLSLRLFRSRRSLPLPYLVLAGYAASNTIGPPESGSGRHGSRRLIVRVGEFKMESQPLRLCGIGQLFTEFLPDTRVPRVEVIYPQPRRAVKVPPMLDGVGSLGSKAKCNLPAQQGDHHNLNFFDIFFNKDETGDDQTGFFCGSPPVRTDNPMAWDSFFTKENLAFSPTIIHESRGQSEVEQSPRSCSSSLDTKPELITQSIISTSSVPSLVISTLS